MNITTNWINEYLTQPLTVDEIIEHLERAGFPCEENRPLDNGDTFLDIEITSNRGDCVSILGLAREISAVAGIPLNPPDCSIPDELIDASASADLTTTVENLETNLCPYYSARIIRGVKVAPSPDWLRNWVESVGLRSINNIVDISNFILYELGQPLHTFDLNLLHEKRIIVRSARDNEKLIAIDESKLTLDPSMLVIADADRPVAVAGVMGGLETEVNNSTTDILLEAASFNALSVRTTSRKLKLFSDSSYRFERGIHPATVAPAADRAARLIAEIAGGKVLQGAVIAGTELPQLLSVTLRTDRCRQLAGVDITTDEMLDRLRSLGLEPILNNDHNIENIQCTIPPHRLDLTREVDLIEEIIRLHGFDRLPAHDRIAMEVVGPQPEVTNRVKVEQTLAALGFYEVVNHSFISIEHAKSFLPDGFEMLRVGDDRRKAEPVLRPSIIPSLLACRKRNQDAGHHNVKLFEQAACFGKKDGQKLENVNLGLIVDAPNQQLGLRQIRSAIDTVLAEVIGSSDSLIVSPAPIRWYEKDGGAVLTVGDTVLGTMGVISPNIQNANDLRTPVVAAEIGIAAFYDQTPEPVPLSEFSPHPAIQRDLSIVVDEEIAWSKIEEVLTEVKLDQLESITFVGIYRGKQIGTGKKSVTTRFTFRAADRTLRHEQVDPQITTVINQLKKEINCTLRDA